MIEIKELLSLSALSAFVSASILSKKKKVWFENLPEISTLKNTDNNNHVSVRDPFFHSDV